MPKYYCDYCKSYLTHDTMSVRKSHLMGRNHIKYYCDYYEQKAKQTGIWTPSESPYEINLDYINRGVPGSRKKTANNSNNYNNNTSNSRESESTQYEIQNSFSLPPPPTLPNFPNPPPSVLRYTEEYREAISKHTQEESY
ncbi:putative U1 small nuclear ribonucleoprotein C [[Candida] railenensis]|uniref:U1 small nuclear ribonucleoprotein C n=1 Tax=[Candida] railenensis TaxID=45579 RepID=A0A9P0QSX4_9ASCO|nr:putative U1 small nuclear ribonucleoprotein C [[Candida] railenensis]